MNKLINISDIKWIYKDKNEYSTIEYINKKEPVFKKYWFIFKAEVEKEIRPHYLVKDENGKTIQIIWEDYGSYYHGYELDNKVPIGFRLKIKPYIIIYLGEKLTQFTKVFDTVDEMENWISDLLEKSENKFQVV